MSTHWVLHPPLLAEIGCNVRCGSDLMNKGEAIRKVVRVFVLDLKIVLH